MNYNIIITLTLIIPILMFCIYYCIWDNPSMGAGCILIYYILQLLVLLALCVL